MDIKEVVTVSVLAEASSPTADVELSMYCLEAQHFLFLCRPVTKKIYTPFYPHNITCLCVIFFQVHEMGDTKQLVLEDTLRILDAKTYNPIFIFHV